MSPTILVGERRLTLPEFLANILEETLDQELAAARTRFLTAGLDALKIVQSGQWIQFGLEKPQQAVYPKLAALARELLGGNEIDDFFFMHKAPGMRIRFSTRTEHKEQTRNLIRNNLEQWRKQGLITSATPGFYEPEEILFGGPNSMRYVHRLFTIDSLAWLDYHALQTNRAPKWAFSLLMLQPLFNELHIIGWEDRGVWARVRDIGLRRLPKLENEQSFAIASQELQQWWRHANESSTQIQGSAQDLLVRYSKEMALATKQWWEGSFIAEGTTVGPREAASYYIIFHWNRARLSSNKQALITEALAAAPQFLEPSNAE